MRIERRSKEDLDNLVVAARAGSSDALDSLLEALWECLQAEFASRRDLQLLSPSRGPSDIIQETIVRVRLSFDTFREESFGALKRWARGIFSNCSLEIERNSRCRNTAERRERIWRAVQQRVDSNRESLTPEETLATEEEASRAFQLLKYLHSDERTIVELRLFEGYSYPEIHQLTNLKSEAARKTFDRAIQRLRELFLSDGKS